MKRSANHPPKVSALLRNLVCGAAVCASLMVPVAFVSAQNAANADAAFNAWTNAYMIRSNGQTYFCNSLTDRSRAFFWGQAYMITAVEDYYDRNPTMATRNLVGDLLLTLLQNETSAWSWDTWNDDVEWACIACIRGYQITGNHSFLDAAANNWKMVYNRGWDSTFGGGIWELQDDRNTGGGKGGLSNYPFIIAGVMLYEATGDGTYRDRCVADYDWARPNCFDANSGRVYEGTGPNGRNGDDNSYNSGLLVNAANSLYRITGNSLYYNDAVKAADHCIAKYNGTNGVMTEDHPANGDFGCDQLVRGLSRFARENNLWSKYYPFLQNNCTAAWNHRRANNNTTWNNFNANTSPTDNVPAMEAEGAVVIQAVTQINSLAGMHFVVSKQSNKALDNGGSSTLGSGIVQYTQQRGPHQAWLFTQNSDTSWNIVSAYSAEALDNGNSTANGAQLLQYTANSDNTNQRWWVDKQSDGSYKIWSKGNSKALDNSSSGADSYKIVLWDWSGGVQQRWNLQ